MAFKRGKMWYLDYSDATGKRHREPWSTSEEAAKKEEKKRKKLILLQRGDPGQFGRIRWDDFKTLLDSNLYSKRKPSTVSHYKNFINWVDQYIAPHLLLNVTSSAVENMRVKLLANGAGKHNVERGIRAGFAIFTWAWKNDLIQKVEWKAVENTHLKPGAPVFLTLEEFKTVTRAWNPANQDPKKPIEHCAQLYLFALLCRRMMLRPSEAWFARWEQTDLDTGEYRLLDEEKSGFNVKVQSYRTIPIPPHLRDYLRELKKIAKSKYLIEWPQGYYNKKLIDGRPMQANRFFRHVSWALSALGFKDATAYSFRHTGATHMVVKMREALSTTGKIMGHKSETTTEIYVHPVTDDMRAAIEKLEAMEYAGENTRPACHISGCAKCPNKGTLTQALLQAAQILNIQK
ncbi:tyrosine-type recombinase/integrase [Candidatus Avelusimicrobium alvi]|uniref:tyrosine-type recombinase/integrase n=1 Tax=Candidatus Avelusimicrobium alvi TaxID=3416221 RepID=UPI003D0BE536